MRRPSRARSRSPESAPSCARTHSGGIRRFREARGQERHDDHRPRRAGAWPHLGEAVATAALPPRQCAIAATATSTAIRKRKVPSNTRRLSATSIPTSNKDTACGAGGGP